MNSQLGDVERRISDSGLTAPEIAQKYGVTVHAITKDWVVEWRKTPGAPRPIGKRGRYNEYDPGEVEKWVRQNRSRPQGGPIYTRDPEGLLTAAEIAEEAGLSENTVRSDLSRGRLTPKEGDVVKDGTKLWRRGSIAAQLRRRRSRRAPKGENRG